MVVVDDNGCCGGCDDDDTGVLAVEGCGGGGKVGDCWADVHAVHAAVHVVMVSQGARRNPRTGVSS